MGLHRVKHKDAIKRLAIKVTADVVELHWFGLVLQICVERDAERARERERERERVPPGGNPFVPNPNERKKERGTFLTDNPDERKRAREERGRGRGARVRHTPGKQGCAEQ